MAKVRDWRYDNIKAMIMLGIVATHFVEPITPGNKLYYFMIMMHCYDMPVFVWISGRFASFNWKRILQKLVYPYLLFQAIYLVFTNVVLDIPRDYQFHMPYWLLWYMMAMIQWSLTIPLLKRIPGNWRWVFLGGTVVVSLLVGYVSDIYYDWNLGRFFYYYPFFCCGYFCKQYKFTPTKKLRIGFAAGTAVILVVLYFFNLPLHVEWWYGAVPYENAVANYSPLHRIVLYAVAVVIGGCILMNMPNKQMRISKIGQNCTPIYYWHGFIVKLVILFDVYARFDSLFTKWLFVMAASVCCLLVLGSDAAVTLSKPFMSWDFGKKQYENIGERLKEWALTVPFYGAIGCCILAAAFWGRMLGYAAIIGAVVCVVLSWPCYGLGQLIADTSALRALKEQEAEQAAACQIETEAAYQESTVGR